MTTSKERVRIALSHEEPDRVPIYAGFTPEMEAALRSKFPGSGDIGAFLGNDVVCSSVGVGNSFYMSEAMEYTCEWGISWRQVPFSGGHYTEMVGHPLADERMIDKFVVPNPLDESRYEETQRILDAYRGTHWIAGNLRATVFECSWYLRGMENLLIDMVERKDTAHAIMDKVMEFSLAAGRRMIGLGIDMLWTGDDVGTQRAMLISPSLWREFLRPRYAHLIEEFRQENPSIVIAYHSDGDITPIIPELIELGVDVLNPVQPGCMDPVAIKARFGTKLSFIGGIDLQRTLPLGSVGDVRNEVRERIRTMGQGGGLILAPAHDVQPDTSIENILAFYDAAKEYGGYPLRM